MKMWVAVIEHIENLIILYYSYVIIVSKGMVFKLEKL